MKARKTQGNSDFDYIFLASVDSRIELIKELSDEELLNLSKYLSTIYNKSAPETFLKFIDKPSFKRPLISWIQSTINTLRVQNDRFKSKYKVYQVSESQVLSLSTSMLGNINQPDNLSSSTFESLKNDILEPLLGNLFDNYSKIEIYIIIEKIQSLETKDFSFFLDKLSADNKEEDIRPSLQKLKDFYDGNIKNFVALNDPSQISIFLHKLFPRIQSELNISLSDLQSAKDKINNNTPDTFWRESSSVIDCLNKFIELFNNSIFIVYKSPPISVDLDHRDSNDQKLKEYGKNFIKAAQLYVEIKRTGAYRDNELKEKHDRLESIYSKLALIEISLQHNPKNYKNFIKYLKEKFKLLGAISESQKAYYKIFTKAFQINNTPSQAIAAKYLDIHKNDHPITIACYLGYLSEVKNFVSNDINLINETTYYGSSALGISINNHKNDIAHFLLDHDNLYIYYPDYNGDNALHIAVMNNNYSIIMRLLNAGMDPNQVNKSDKSALDMAYTYGNDFLIQLLLENNAKTFCISSTIKSYIKSFNSFLCCSSLNTSELTTHPIFIEHQYSSAMFTPSLESNRQIQSI